MTRTFRTPRHLSASVHHRLNAYALAASTAGVGLLAFVQPSEAKVIYTRAHERIHLFTPVPLDLNHDGKTDFFLTNDNGHGTSFSASFLSVFPGSKSSGRSSPNLIWGKSNSASALRAGVRVEAGKGFGSRHTGMASARFNYVHHTTMFGGAWANGGKGVKDRYLGLEFFIKGKPHFGWARLSVEMSKGPQGTLTGYAYETIPNKAIITGKTHGPDIITVQDGSLGALAAGSSAHRK